MKKLFIVLLIGALTAGLLLSGCGPAENNGNDGNNAEPPAADNDLVIAMGAEPENLDPLKMMSSPAATIAEHMVETLIYLDVDGNLVPALAESWEPAEDGLSWYLNLRQGVEFHDGTPFNAEAVKYNLDRFMGVDDPENAAVYSFLLGEVSSVEVVDEYTVQIFLNQTFAPIASHLSHSFIGMHSPASLEALADGESVEAPVGTGPFKFESWDRGTQIVMARNDDYWGGAPQLETVTFKFVPEAGSRVLMLETAEADAIMSVPPTDIERLEAMDEIDVVPQTSVRLIYLGFNQEREEFKDARVRQALNHAINKDVLIETIFRGVGQPSTAPVVPAIFGYTEVGPYEYNVEKAKELLADAGYPDGFDIELYHPTGRYPQDATVTEAVQAMLKEVGINATLTTYDWGTYLDTVIVPPEEAEHDMFMLGWGTVTLDADYGLYALFHSSQWPPRNNVSYYANDEVDALLEEARVTADRAVREDLYKQAIEIIWEDAPWLFLYDEGQVNAVRSNVKGLIHHPLENLSAWDAYIE
ncbi:MAG: glutathione ABC transporter substrate-binding protein [Bacillota bacterium]|nr:glutathione ABC transporter substrate-binding protein [Bacillota bacterium]MDW7682627.1 glutathione ABC transporter substrate-binding protein [Bacillota bacterium]